MAPGVLIEVLTVMTKVVNLVPYVPDFNKNGKVTY